MEFTNSTFSQTPKPEAKRPFSYSLRLRNSIASPKLRESFENSLVKEELQLVRNRLNKLVKVRCVMRKEIEMAQEKSTHLLRLQRENLANKEKKKMREEQKRKNIESRRYSFSLSRVERREKKNFAVQQCYMQKKSKAELVKELKNSWEKDAKDMKINDLSRKSEIAQKVKLISNKHKEFRDFNQNSYRKFIRKSYNESIEKQRNFGSRLRSQICRIEEEELKIIDSLANTINLRNRRLSDLHQLIEVSKIPVGKRPNY